MKLFDPSWMAAYRKKHLYDATEDEIHSLESSRSDLVGACLGLTGLGGIVSWMALSSQGTNIIHVVGGLVAAAGTLFFLLGAVLAFLSPGPFYNYGRAKELRELLEARRRQQGQPARAATEMQPTATDAWAAGGWDGPPPPSAPQPERYGMFGVYLRVLGLREDEADVETIRQAYAQACLRNHPDKNPGDEEAAARFKLVQEAYEYLTERGLL